MSALGIWQGSFSLVESDANALVRPVGYISNERSSDFETVSGLEFSGIVDENCNIERHKLQHLPLLVCVGDPAFRKKFWEQNKKKRFAPISMKPH